MQPPPPAPSPGVVEWSQQAANFLRLVSRAYPDGAPPKEVADASNRIWDVAARAARLEGELATHAKQLESVEKRGRALRAEIGRKVDELSSEESRAARQAAEERSREVRINARIKRTEGILRELLADADKTERKAVDLRTARKIFERVGAAHARIEALREVGQDYKDRALKHEQRAAELRQQTDDLRSQLRRYGDALENELASGQERIAVRVREALSYEKTFVKDSNLLISHLRERPECQELLEEITEELKAGLRHDTLEDTRHSAAAN